MLNPQPIDCGVYIDEQLIQRLFQLLLFFNHWGTHGIVRRQLRANIDDLVQLLFELATLEGNCLLYNDEVGFEQGMGYQLIVSMFVSIHTPQSMFFFQNKNHLWKTRHG